MRSLLCLVAVGALAVVSATPAAAVPEGTVSWLALGDSYASGEGIPGARLPCARSASAYGPVATGYLRSQRSWRIGAGALVACTGAVTAELFGPGDPDDRSQVDQAAALGVERADLVTLSMGGNDLGFSDVLIGCLLLTPAVRMTWDDVFGPGIEVRPDGCAETSHELEVRVDNLVEPGGPIGPSDGLSDFYRQVLHRTVTSRGQLVVVGYPRIFASVDLWPEWRGRVCQNITKTDAAMLNEVSDHLDAALADAVDEADPSGARITYVSRAELFSEGRRDRSLCGPPGVEWMNGITLGNGRPEQSFHPNSLGHAATAREVAAGFDEHFGIRAAPQPEPPDATSPPPTQAPPITEPTSYDIGDSFEDTCTVAWPTAPVRSTSFIEMTTTCLDVPGQFQFVQIGYPDPDLPVTPSNATMEVSGEVVDIAESEYGFRILVVLADDIDL